MYKVLTVFYSLLTVLRVLRVLSVDYLVLILSPMPQVTEQGDQSAHTETSHTAAPQSHFKENISVLKSFRNLLKSKKNVTKSGVPDVRLTLSFDLYFISV